MLGLPKLQNFHKQIFNLTVYHIELNTLNLVETTNKVEILVGRGEVDTLPVLHHDGSEVGGGGGTRGDGEFRM